MKTKIGIVMLIMPALVLFLVKLIFFITALETSKIILICALLLWMGIGAGLLLFDVFSDSEDLGGNPHT